MGGITFLAMSCWNLGQIFCPFHVLSAPLPPSLAPVPCLYTSILHPFHASSMPICTLFMPFLSPLCPFSTPSVSLLRPAVPLSYPSMPFLCHFFTHSASFFCTHQQTFCTLLCQSMPLLSILIGLNVYTSPVYLAGKIPLV